MPLSPSLVAVGDAPAETRRLLEQARVEGHRFHWINGVIETWSGELAKGELSGFLLTGPKDEAVGLALVRDRAGFARSVWIYLAAEVRQPATLRSLIDLIASAPGGLPIIQVSGEVGLPEGVDTDRVLGPLGFVRLERAEMRFPPDRPLPRLPGPEPTGMRGLGTEDAESLSRLFARAYWSTPWERALFASRADPIESARAETATLMGTEYGEWLSWASFGVPEGRGLIGTTFVNRFEGPLISNVMTDPDARGRGFAAHLLRATVAALRERETETPRLAVTLRNVRALHVYERFGFERNDALNGSTWVQPSLVGGSGPPPPKL